MSVRHALLGLLSQRPRHGYELHAAFEAVVGGEKNWAVKPAQIYTTLARLEDGGLVAEDGTGQDGGPEKRIFALTESGRQELRRWMLTPVQATFQQSEFFLKLMLALASEEVDARKVIYTQRSNLYQQLHTLTAQRSAADPQCELAHILLLDQAIMHLEADLRWVEMIEARLDEVRRQPIPEPEARPRGRPPRKGKEG